MSNRIAIGLLIGALVGVPGLTSAQEPSGTLEEFAAEAAHTKAEHEALAKFYTEEAAKARKLAHHHESMERAYLGSKNGNKQAFTTHCKRIAEQQESMAKEYDALAKLHEDEAKKAP